MGGSGPYSVTCDKLDDTHHSGAKWFFSRKEIEENSPSRRDGIDLKKETSLRKSYCTFLQDLGMRLKVPQVTIATAIVFCHRFFLRQSHARNDSRTIATACMFLAGKVEETPHPLKDVIIISYEIIHKKDPSIMQKIKQKEVYEQQKEIILLGERVVLATLAFDLTVHHPYKPLVEALKKLKVAQNTLAQVAWNFVNDGLRTSLCLQHKPHHIAAGAISLAGKFLNVKLPSNGKKVWWEEFDVTSRQLEDVSNQMMELYNQKRSATSSRPNEVKGSTVTGSNRSMAMASTISENPISASGSDAIGTVTIKKGSQVTPADHRVGEGKDCLFNELMPFPITCLERPMGDEVKDEKGELTEARDDQKSSHDQRDLIEKIDTVGVKTTMQKRRKSQDGAALRTELKEDALTERELETDIELAREDEKKEQKNQPFPTEQAGISNERSFSHGTAIFTPND